MKRLLTLTVLKMFGKALLLTVFIGIVIAVIGNNSKWDTSIKYSNAFFTAGCIVIIGGASSRMGASQEWNKFQLFSAESFRSMSIRERVDFIIDVSSSLSLVILCGLSGTMLILISWIVAKIG